MDKRYFFSYTVDLISHVFFFLDLVENLVNIEILVHVLFPGLMIVVIRITCFLTKSRARTDMERLNRIACESKQIVSQTICRLLQGN